MIARARVNFRGGWTRRQRDGKTLAFCFGVECRPVEDPPSSWILGTMKPGSYIKAAIRNYGLPPSLRVNVILSPRCRTGVWERTVTVEFTMKPTRFMTRPTARELWESVPFRVATLARIVGAGSDACITRKWNDYWEPRILHAS